MRVEKLIYHIRDQKVMLDCDLATLYGVETGALNRQVKRNIDRFPEDFMFQLSKREFEELRNFDSDFKLKTFGRKFRPYVFTEYGIAALSGVIHSNVAIAVNNSIIRTFVKMRKLLNKESTLVDKMECMENSYNKLFAIIFERLELLEGNPIETRKPGKRIGIMKVD